MVFLVTALIVSDGIASAHLLGCFTACAPAPDAGTNTVCYGSMPNDAQNTPNDY